MFSLPTSIPSLVITQLVEDDAQEHFELVGQDRSHLAAWLPWVDATKSVRDVASFIAVSMASWSGRQSLACALRLDGRIIGGIGIVEWEPANEAVSLGYWLGHDFRGHGYMTEAVKTLANYCFTELGIHRIVIRAATSNTASRAIPERLGFVHEGTLRGATKLASGYHDLAVYGLLQSEWHPSSPTD